MWQLPTEIRKTQSEHPQNLPPLPWVSENREGSGLAWPLLAVRGLWGFMGQGLVLVTFYSPQDRFFRGSSLTFCITCGRLFSFSCASMVEKDAEINPALFISNQRKRNFVKI